VVHTSAVGSGPREDIIQALNGVMRSVEGLTCIHCCANIDWSILMETNTDAINFDAYEHADKIALYPKELHAFLERGGIFAWGIVPTSDDKIVQESTTTLMNKLERDLQMLTAGGIDRQTLFQSSILTPSCATSSMSLELGERAFQMTSELSQRMREKYFRE
jgi:hypothetical protein